MKINNTIQLRDELDEVYNTLFKSTQNAISVRIWCNLRDTEFDDLLYNIWLSTYVNVCNSG